MLAFSKESTTANRAVQSERNTTRKKRPKREKHHISSNHNKLPTLLTDILQQTQNIRKSVTLFTKNGDTTTQQQLGKTFNFQ